MDCMENIAVIRLKGFGWCYVVDRETVLQDLSYQYEDTDRVAGYDVYSNDDGEYFAVKEDK